MPQTPWFSFRKIFIITVDTSPWNCKYFGKYPVRRRFRTQGTPHGLRQKSIKQLAKVTALRFDKLDGVYIIAYRKKPIYVGRAQGGESIFKRLRKHRVKFSGSNVGDVTHPKRYQKFVIQRYDREPRLIKTDTLRDFSFSAFYFKKPPKGTLRAPLLEKLRKLEYQVYWKLKNEFPSEMILNAPLNTKKSPIGKIKVRLPGTSAKLKPKMKKRMH